MAIRNIRVLGDEILRKKAKEITEVTPRIQELIDEMEMVDFAKTPIFARQLKHKAL